MHSQFPCPICGQARATLESACQSCSWQPEQIQPESEVVVERAIYGPLVCGVIALVLDLSAVVVVGWIILNPSIGSFGKGLQVLGVYSVFSFLIVPAAVVLALVGYSKQKMRFSTIALIIATIAMVVNMLLWLYVFG